jgi:hypothetical protein
MLSKEFLALPASFIMKRYLMNRGTRGLTEVRNTPSKRLVT